MPLEDLGSQQPAISDAETAFAAEVVRVRASKTLGETGRLLELFDFLSGRGAAAEPASQAEIAESVFGQAAATDSDDATVRVYIHRLRKRLDDYYAEHSSENGASRLVIPAGTYALRLREGEQEVIEEEQGKVARWYEFARANLTIVAPLALLAVVIVGFTLGRVSDGARSAAPVNDIWKPFVDSDRGTVVVVGDYYMFGEYDPLHPEDGRLIREFAINSKTDLARLQESEPARYEMSTDMGLTYLPLSTAYGLQSLMPVLSQNRYPIAVIPASQVDADTFRYWNVVYIGLVSGMGMMENMNFMSSGFAKGETYDDLVDTANSKTYTSGEALKLASSQYYRDYGYVSVFHEPGGALVAVVAGARDTGLRGIAPLVARADLPPELERLAKQGGDKGFEALIEITGQQGANLSQKVVEARERPVGH